MIYIPLDATSDGELTFERYSITIGQGGSANTAGGDSTILTSQPLGNLYAQVGEEDLVLVAVALVVLLVAQMVMVVVHHLELSLDNRENLEHMDLDMVVVVPPRPVIMDMGLVAAAVLVDQDIQDLMDLTKEEVVLVKVDLFSLVLLLLVVAVVELVVMVVKTTVVKVDLVAAVVERTLVITAATATKHWRRWRRIR